MNSILDMLSSLFGTSKQHKQTHRENRSPFSSPYTTITSTLGARRTEPNERRRIAANFDGQDPDDGEDAAEDDRLLEEEEYIEEEQEEDEVEEEDEDEDEDGDNTPLLPIFSAAHLGEQKGLLNEVSC